MCWSNLLLPPGGIFPALPAMLVVRELDERSPAPGGVSAWRLALVPMVDLLWPNYFLCSICPGTVHYVDSFPPTVLAVQYICLEAIQHQLFPAILTMPPAIKARVGWRVQHVVGGN